MLLRVYICFEILFIIISGGFKERAEGAAASPFPLATSHQHGLWSCAVAVRPFVPRHSIRLPLLKILDPPLIIIIISTIYFQVKQDEKVQ